MKYTVSITESAKRDLKEIAAYILSWSKEKGLAERTIRELQAACLSLEEFPNRGALPRERMLRTAGYRFLTQGDYLIFYKVEEAAKTVLIMAVLNGRRDYMRFIKQLL